MYYMYIRVLYVYIVYMYVYITHPLPMYANSRLEISILFQL